MPNHFNLLLTFVAAGIALLAIRLIIILVKNNKIRKNIEAGNFIYFRDFEKNWIMAKSGNKGIAGYKYNDGPGCYVIIICDELVTDGDYSTYENVYIGQSVHICQRVHQHFNGKGNGDVYADIKYGKHVYVQFIPCDKKDMNVLEKKLISVFDATASYNTTRGGGKRR